jgi:hypothetical protein
MNMAYRRSWRNIGKNRVKWALEQGKTASATPTSTSLNVYIGRSMNGADLYCPLSKGTS